MDSIHDFLYIDYFIGKTTYYLIFWGIIAARRLYIKKFLLCNNASGFSQLLALLNNYDAVLVLMDHDTVQGIDKIDVQSHKVYIYIKDGFVSNTYNIFIRKEFQGFGQANMQKIIS